MGKECTIKRPYRSWTKEEQIAYLDWDEADDQRVQAQVEAAIAQERASGSFINRRGIQYIWDAAEADNQEQQALYEAPDNVGGRARPE
jgi:hypothetical protein